MKKSKTTLQSRHCHGTGPIRNSQSTISLCMIVKDEEQFLSRCLDSIKDCVDEMIIVDTGSRDRTVEIAERYNARVYHHDWENSFSMARNYSLQYATSEWVLILDADEEIDKADAHKLKETVRDNSANVILLPVFSKSYKGKNLGVGNSERIFRNHLGFQYEGIVHNILRCSGPFKKSNIKIHHYGYDLDEKKMVKKFERTSTLLKDRIREEPEDPVPHHYLASSYLDRDMNDACIGEALEAARLFELLDSKAEIRFLNYYIAGIAYFRKQETQNAEKFALKAIKHFPGYLDAYCLLSSIYFLRREYESCLEVTHKYLGLLMSIEDNPSKIPSIPFNTIHHARLAYSRMAIIYFEQDMESDGLQAFESARKCAENVWEPCLLIGRHFSEKGDLKLAEKFLMEGLDCCCHNKDLLYSISEIHEKSGAQDKALKYLNEILVYHSGETYAQFRIGLILIKKGLSADAISVFKSILDKDPNHIGALFKLAMSYEMVKDYDMAKSTYCKILAAMPENPETLVKLGNLYLQESDHIKARECFVKTIQLNKYPVESYIAMSKISIYLKDLECCAVNCEKLLNVLALPRNVTTKSTSDLSKLFVFIGENLIKQQRVDLANSSFELAVILGSENTLV
ncbi:MAG: glycosyltransferase [Planctomycetes bacterium]|nr:glycosyltransferase [Planctomycetota bacterium]